MRHLIVVVIAAVNWFIGTAWAYEEAPVPNGGTLVGTVMLEGKVPRPKGL